MSRKTVQVLTTLALLAGTSLASAQNGWPVYNDGSEYSRQGTYLIGAVAIGLENFPKNFGTGPLLINESKDTDNSVGFSFRAGQRFHPNFAAEVAFDYQDNFKLKIRGLGYDYKFTFQNWSLMGNLKAYLPAGAFQPYALAGIGIMGTKFKEKYTASGGTDWHSDKETVFGARLGGGMDVYVGPNVFINVEGSYIFATGGHRYLGYRNAKATDFEFGSINFGLGYRF